MGSCPRELHVVVLVGYCWALFLSAGELSPQWGVVLEPVILTVTKDLKLQGSANFKFKTTTVSCEHNYHEQLMVSNALRTMILINCALQIGKI